MTALAIKEQTSELPDQSSLHDEPGVQRLFTGCETEVLNFLGRRPAHSAYLSGLIHANGLESPLNRGDFYAYRDGKNRIKGVALIGHAVTFEVTSNRAARALGLVSSKHFNSILVRGESKRLRAFWAPYGDLRRVANKKCREHLLELKVPFATEDLDCCLRPATADELDQVVAMNLDLIAAERGTDQLPLDRAGFEDRLLQRIKSEQVWVWVSEGKVIFKAEIITRTPEVIYLEGVFVDQDARGKGNGIRSMRQLGRSLLKDTKSICLFVNESNVAALGLYAKAGYQTLGQYETIYLKSNPA
ncbi:MAG: hypothetical protein DMF69_12445 [Acidobacteria bacterium]|nr:MAG: hypothetical protein DMF69_12445 [Acidobacteriota bacterium]